MAFQMMMTLKLIGLAFEVHDSENTGSQTMRYTNVNPSVLDIFHYSFTHIGILTGFIKVI
jgi:lysophospholipid acyltransferase 7